MRIVSIIFVGVLVLSSDLHSQSGTSVAEGPATISATPSNLPEKAVTSDNPDQLDELLLRKKLEKIHGEFGRATKSSWDVAFNGEIIRWDWNGGWSCATKKEVIDCANWAPFSLQWFETKNSWLKPWTRIKKNEVILDSEKRIPTMTTSSTTDPITGEVVEAPQANVNEPIRLSGQRLALQAWNFSSSEKEVKVFTSLRKSWVERIDHDGMSEYIEWQRNPKSKLLQIQQLILERDGQRLTARRVDVAPEPKKK